MLKVQLKDTWICECNTEWSNTIDRCRVCRRAKNI